MKTRILVLALAAVIDPAIISDRACAQTCSSARVDSYGDPLPEGAIARLGTMRMRHGHIISGLAFSGDGKSIIASDYYSGVHIWDADEGIEVRRFFTDDYYCHRLAISPDGKTLAVAGGNLTVWLVDPTTGRQFGSLPDQRQQIGQLLFSPDSSLLAMIDGYEKVRVFDVATRRLVKTVTFETNIGHVAFSSDGKLLACSVGSSIALWNLERGNEVRRLRNDRDSHHSLSATFAPNGPMAVCGYDDGSVRLFDADGVKEIRRFKREGPAVTGGPAQWGWSSYTSVNFSPDGKTLAISREPGRIDLFDVDSGKKRHTLTFDSILRASHIAFSPDGKKLAHTGADSWSGDCAIHVWDVDKGKEINPRTGHGSPVTSVAVSPNGTIATAGNDGIVHLWEGPSGKHLMRLVGHWGRRPQVSFSRDGKRVISFGSWGGDGTLHIWDAKIGKVVNRFELQGIDVFWETVAPDGNTAASVDSKARLGRLHDLNTGKVTREITDDFHRPIALSPAGDKLVGLDGILWSIADRKELVNIGRVYGSNTSVRFSADGRRLVAAVLPEGWQKKYTSDPPAEEIAAVDQLAGMRIRRFGMRDEKYHAIKAVALSTDGRTAAAVYHFGYKGNEQEITLWETETGRKRGTFRGHIGLVSSVAMSPDGRFLVTGADDTSAIVWDATKQQDRKTAARPDLAAILKDLADESAKRAYAAEWALIDFPKEAVSFLEKRRELFAATDVQTIQRWIRDLDSDKFADRERASQELAWIVDEAGPHLKKALEVKPSAEAQQRIGLLLQKRSLGISGKDLQRYRVIEVLEHIAMDTSPGADATRLAVELLKKFAGGDPDARMTLEAKASLERLELRAKFGRE
jgi:WD40 repeat protein